MANRVSFETEVGEGDTEGVQAEGKVAGIKGWFISGFIGDFKSLSGPFSGKGSSYINRLDGRAHILLFYLFPIEYMRKLGR